MEFISTLDKTTETNKTNTYMSLVEPDRSKTSIIYFAKNGGHDEHSNKRDIQGLQKIIEYTEDRLGIENIQTDQTNQQTHSSLPLCDQESGMLESSINSRFNMQIVCDGHGGHETANLAVQLFFEYIKNNTPNDHNDILTYLETLAEHLYTNIKIQLPYTHSGSTLLIACIDNHNDVLYVANLGDSKCVVARKNENDDFYSLVFSTTDLSCDNPDEVERLRSLGYDIIGEIPRIKADGLKANGMQPTAGLGDHHNDSTRLDPLRRNPEISTIFIKSGDIIILGSDGLYEDCIYTQSKNGRGEIKCLGSAKSDNMICNQISRTMSFYNSIISEEIADYTSINLAQTMLDIHYEDLLKSYASHIPTYFRSINCMVNRSDDHIHRCRNADKTSPWCDDNLKTVVENGSDNKSIIFTVYKPT